MTSRTRRWLGSTRRRLAVAISTERPEADVDRTRLALFARIGRLNDLDIDTPSRLEALLDAMLPDIADACAIFLIDDDHLYLTGARHVDAGRQPELADPALRGPFALSSGHPTARAVRARRPVLDTPSADRVGTRLRALNVGSLLTVPLIRHDEPVGALLLAFSPTRAPTGPDDITFSIELARRVTVSLETGHRHERERHVAETLQEHLLPRELPRVVGVGLAGRYLGATRGIYVGGDWYDAVALGGSRVAVAIGDVAGHGLSAANAMGRLRAGLRLCMIDGLGPADALGRLNRYSFSFEESVMATVQVGIVDSRTREFCFASAGHPPPLVVTPDDARLLDGAVGVPLLAAEDATYEEVAVTLPEDAAVLLYTDGLVERRGESLTVGLARLADVARRSFDRFDDALDTLLDELLPGGGDDDVALLALRCVPTSFELEVEASPPELATVRRHLRAWLEELGTMPSDVADILTAVNEAAANVVEHAYRDERGTLRIDGSAGRDGVVLSVSDSGRWRPPVPSDERGRGILMMRRLMDDVVVTPGSTVGGGTTVRLTHLLDPHT